jgi:hypothetical protein
VSTLDYKLEPAIRVRRLEVIMGTEQRRLSLASVTATPCALKLRAGESTIPRRVIDWQKHLKQRPAQNSVRRPTISLGDKSRSRCPPQSRAQRSQPRDEFALDRGLRIVVSDYRNLECAEVFAVLQAVDHPLRGQPSRRALRLACRLPSSVLCLVLWRVFPRLASICRNVFIGRSMPASGVCDPC